MRFRTPSIMIFCLISACSLFTVFSISSAFAVNSSLFAGGEIDTRGQSFSYLGLDLTQKISENIGISGRLIPNFLTYKFHSGDELVKATSPGVYAVAGIKLFLKQTTFGLWGGTEYRHTNLSPDIKSAEVKCYGNSLHS